MSFVGQTERMTPRYKRNQTKCLTRPLTKAAFHKITPQRPPALLDMPPLPPLYRALFRGGLILFDSLTVILSSVNLSFWSGITPQNIKGTLIPKMCQSSVLSCNTPFPSLSFHFFRSGWDDRVLAPHLLFRLHTGSSAWPVKGRVFSVSQQQGDVTQCENQSPKSYWD